MNDGFQKNGFCVAVARWDEMLYKIATPPAQALRSADGKPFLWCVDVCLHHSLRPEGVVANDDEGGGAACDAARDAQEGVAEAPPVDGESCLDDEQHPEGACGQSACHSLSPDLPGLRPVEDGI